MPRRSGFTHFGSLPFIRPQYKEQIKLIQDQIKAVMNYAGLGDTISASSPNQFHMTLCMLKLSQQASDKAAQALEHNMDKIRQVMRDTTLTTSKINYFTERDGENLQGPKYIRVIYLQVQQDEQFQKILNVTDLMIKILLQSEVITGKSLSMMGIQYNPQKKMYRNKNPHITLFKCRNLHEDKNFIKIFKSHFQKQFQGKKFHCDSVDISYRFKRDENKYFHPTWKLAFK